MQTKTASNRTSKKLKGYYIRAYAKTALIGSEIQDKLPKI